MHIWWTITMDVILKNKEKRTMRNLKSIQVVESWSQNDSSVSWRQVCPHVFDTDRGNGGTSNHWELITLMTVGDTIQITFLFEWIWRHWTLEYWYTIDRAFISDVDTYKTGSTIHGCRSSTSRLTKNRTMISITIPVDQEGHFSV